MVKQNGAAFPRGSLSSRVVVDDGGRAQAPTPSGLMNLGTVSKVGAGGQSGTDSGADRQTTVQV
jgi:hypothetical protein